MEKLKRTPLYNRHREFGAKLVPFAGFEMPLQYKGILHEAKAVRSSCGIFDVSHMGEIEISGKDALSFVSYITLNNPAKLKEYQAQYSGMCYPTGGMVDDIVVYNFPDKFLIVVNAANIEKDYEWMVKNKKGDVKIENKSDYWALIAVQGPDAIKIFEKIFDGEIPPKRFRFRQGKINGIDVFLSRTGYTGEDGFEVFVTSENAVKIWDWIFEAGKEFGIEPAGLGARDILRLEAGYCLYGNDIDENTTPLEAGLSWIVKFDKDNFIGKDALLKQKEEGLKRKLTGFIVEDKIIPRKGYDIYKGDEKAGVVTSGGFSPHLNCPIGMGYISLPFEEGEEIKIDCRGKKVKARIKPGGFVRKV